MIENSTPTYGESGDWRVRLAAVRAPDEKVVFDVSPEFMETRSVNYKGHEPIQMPGQLTYYVNSASRTFNISQIKLISRTPKEADTTLKTLHQLRGWTMPYFGESEPSGFPPNVLLLSAYSKDDAHTNTGQHISKVPVVITNLSIPYPVDCDYIPSETLKIPVPTLMVIDMSLTESHTPEEYENFNLELYKKGIMGGY